MVGGNNRKYPWALGHMTIGEPIFIKGRGFGLKAARAARMWCYRHYPGGSVVVRARSVPGGVSILFHEAREKEARVS